MFMTYEKLVTAGACEEQALLFKQLFPNGMRVTAELCRKYVDKFDFDWASRLFPDAQRGEYERARDSALAEYVRVKASEWAEYERITASARAEYERDKAPAWAEYVRTRAVAFGTLAETVE